MNVSPSRHNSLIANPANDTGANSNLNDQTPMTNKAPIFNDQWDLDIGHWDLRIGALQTGALQYVSDH
jgi:hypothetical protein